MTLIILIFLWVVIGGGIGTGIGSDKGRLADGLVLGLFLGPIGWLICGLLPETADHKAKEALKREKKELKRGSIKKCPQCAELVKKEAVKCRFCGYDFNE